MRKVVIESIIRNIANIHLQLLKVSDSEYLLVCIWIRNYKITKPKILFDGFSKILWKGFGVFVNKQIFRLINMLSVLRLRRCENKRDINIISSNPLSQFFSCQLIFYPITTKIGRASCRERV